MAIGSHHSNASQTDVWFTPPAIIEALGGAESFDLDPCSHVSRPWSTAREHYTEAENGLLLPWFGRVWLNPPYSRELLAAFLGRMAHHGEGTALIFARTETDAFFENVWAAASGVLFIRGRLHFCGPDGIAAKGNAGAPSVLIAYGNDDRDILAASPIDGQFIPLRLPRSYVMAGLAQSWREALDDWLAAKAGPVSLDELYRAFASHPKARRNRNWKAKLRQTLERAGHARVEKGVWQRRAA